MRMVNFMAGRRTGSAEEVSSWTTIDSTWSWSPRGDTRTPENRRETRAQQESETEEDQETKTGRAFAL